MVRMKNKFLKKSLKFNFKYITTKKTRLLSLILAFEFQIKFIFLFYSKRKERISFK
jgi:hypothetical protein